MCVVRLIILLQISHYVSDEDDLVVSGCCTVSDVVAAAGFSSYDQLCPSVVVPEAVGVLARAGNVGPGHGQPDGTLLACWSPAADSGCRKFRLCSIFSAYKKKILHISSSSPPPLEYLNCYSRSDQFW